MTSIFINIFRFCCSKLAMALCGLGLCCPCLADFLNNDKRSNTNQSVFYNYQQNIQLKLTPVSMMDDATLIASAEARLDNGMNKRDRELNTQWLLQDENNTWSGGRAVGKIFKTGVQQFLANRSLASSDLMEQPAQQETAPLWQNYSVSLAGDKLILGMRFQF